MSNRLKLQFGAVVLALALAIPAAASDQLADIKKAGVLRVAAAAT